MPSIQKVEAWMNLLGTEKVYMTLNAPSSSNILEYWILSLWDATDFFLKDPWTHIGTGIYILEKCLITQSIINFLT